jgi:hypothetical protein
MHNQNSIRYREKSAGWQIACDLGILPKIRWVSHRLDRCVLGFREAKRFLMYQYLGFFFGAIYIALIKLTPFFPLNLYERIA